MANALGERLGRRRGRRTAALDHTEYGLRTELTRSINYELHARISAGNNRAMFAASRLSQRFLSHVRRRGFTFHVTGTSRERHNAATGVFNSFLIGALLMFPTYV